MMPNARFLLIPALAAAACACAQRGLAKQVAFDRPETRAAGKLAVTSPAFAANGVLPLAYTGYGQKRMAPIAWSGVPARAKAVVFLLQDPDAPGDQPFVHWLLYNVSPRVRRLPTPPGHPSGVVGTNSTNARDYYPPTPPPGPAHRYFYQVFALDAPIRPRGTDVEAVLAAMRGHVLAKGVLMARFQKP